MAQDPRRCTTPHAALIDKQARHRDSVRITGLPREESMLSVTPTMQARPLAGKEDVGRFINVSNQFAIVTVAPQDPQKVLNIAAFDTASRSFIHSQYNGVDALVFVDSFQFEPDLSQPISLGRPSVTARATAFLDNSGVYVVVVIRPTDFRLVSLNSGELVAWNGQPMFAIPSWRIVAVSANGQRSQLIAV
jgi:hypothetical protein